MTAISQSQARALAEQHGRAGLGEFGYASAKVLRDDFLEAEHCWMFFTSDASLRPADAAPETKLAHVVSKRGSYVMVQDFSDDMHKLAATLRAMSDYFHQRAE